MVIKMAMAIKLSTVISTSAFFYQLLFIHHRMTITFYGLDAAGVNSFMGLSRSVTSCLSMYNTTAVLSSRPSIVADYFCRDIHRKVVMEKEGWSW